MLSICKAVICDPRVVACFVTMCLIFSDDNVAEPYFTGWDPGTAMVLSIILGQAFALAIVRRWDAWSQGMLVLAVLGKCTLQPLFFMSDATLPLLGTFLLAHFIIAGFTRLSPVAQCNPHWIACCSLGCLAAVMIFAFLGFILHRALPSNGIWGFACINSPRVLFPYCFWSALKFHVNFPLPHCATHAEVTPRQHYPIKKQP